VNVRNESGAEQRDFGFIHRLRGLDSAKKPRRGKLLIAPPK